MVCQESPAPRAKQKKNAATTAQSKAAAAEILHRKLKQEFRREIPYEFAADAPGTTRSVCVCVCVCVCLSVCA